MDRRGALIAALACAPALATACAARELPPLPSAVLSVDTDLSVPRTVTRLRIDVYAEDGTWLSSRDFPRITPAEWPASFGVVSPDESKATTVLVRLRAYPEGATRDYRGESYDAPVAYTPTAVAGALGDLCAHAEELPMLEVRTLRRGGTALTTCSCESPSTRAGSTAAMIRVPKADTYRVEIVAEVPTNDVNGADLPTIFLRRACDDAKSEAACAQASNDTAATDLVHITMALGPGTYWLLTAGPVAEPADLTLRWGPASQWGKDAAPLPSVAARAVPDRPIPRLVDATGDVTPASEPLPAATVDRLVRVRLAPGHTGTVPVVLSGACAGAMAKLPAASDSRVSADDALTCVADPSELAPPAVVDPSDAPAPSSALGTFARDACDASESDDQIACVPGGDTVLGGPLLDGLDVTGIVPPLPVRVVALHKFFMDKHEFTVGRYRQALAGGFKSNLRPPIMNDASFPAVEDPSADNLIVEATYTSTAREREAFPLNTVTWGYARALCQWAGGDLPSEAQWEYAAASAGRPTRAAFPWGDDPATCDRAVLGRSTTLAGPCVGPVLEAVDSPASRADTNALGIVGLAGSLLEWTRDAAARYDAPCWGAAGVLDPVCEDPDAPLRVQRGGSFRSALFMADVTARQAWSTDSRNETYGLRCVYAHSPATRWSGP